MKLPWQTKVFLFGAVEDVYVFIQHWKTFDIKLMFISRGQPASHSLETRTTQPSFELQANESQKYFSSQWGWNLPILFPHSPTRTVRKKEAFLELWFDPQRERSTIWLDISRGVFIYSRRKLPSVESMGHPPQHYPLSCGSQTSQHHLLSRIL